MIITKAIGYMSDEMENDYEHITENYKSKEGRVPTNKLDVVFSTNFSTSRRFCGSCLRAA